MLIKFIDYKDKVHWVNPAYIKWVRDKGSNKVHVDISGSAIGIMVKGSAEEVAGLINLAVQEAAMLGLGPLADNAPGTPGTAQIEQERATNDSTQTAIISSVIIGG